MKVFSNKKLLGIISLVALSVLSFKTGSTTTTDRYINLTVSDILLQDAFRIIAHVETNNTHKAFNKHTKAHGIVQIRSICINDVNRIYNTNYKKHDAYSIKKSFEVFYLYTKAYCRNLSIYEIGRVWNAGPHGRLTKAYATKLNHSKGNYNNAMGKNINVKHTNLNLRNASCIWI